MRERIKSSPAPAVSKYIIEPRLTSSLERDFQNLLAVNKAHAVMLVQQGVLTKKAGAAIVLGLVEMESNGTPGLNVDLALEDIYLNVEQALIQKVGLEVGGRLHTGRSRNDIYATLTRMSVREALIDLLGAVFNCTEQLLKLAETHTATLMSGYTHLQPAQPTTLGHYLVSVSLALNRDVQRLLDVYPRLNLSPLGAAAFAGTGFPIDREITAELMGFDGLVESTLDSVASRDYISELLAALAMMGVTWSRLAQDIYLWCTDEWGTVEVADEVAVTSSIMPQKKNPITLEHIKGKAGHLIGALMDTLAVQKNVSFMHCGDMSYEAVRPFWEAMYQAEAVVNLARETLAGLKVNKELMAQRAAENFSTATGLADYLVRERGLPFRVAHAIVGNVIVITLGRGLRADGISSELVDEVAREVTGEPLGLSDEQVKEALNPLLQLQGKRTAGSPSEAETKKLIHIANSSLAQQRSTTTKWRAQLNEAGQKLGEAVENLAA